MGVGVEPLVRRAVWIIAPAHTAGVFHSVGPKDIVTSDSLGDRGHTSSMQEKRRAKSPTSSEKPPHKSRTFHPHRVVNKYLLDTKYVHRETVTRLLGPKEETLTSVLFSTATWPQFLEPSAKSLRLSCGDNSAFQTDTKLLVNDKQCVHRRVHWTLPLCLYAAVCNAEK